MNVLVTGGAGFIGSHVVDALLKDGHAVSCLDNFSTGDKKNLFGVICNKADITDPTEVRRCFATYHPEVVLHLAAQSAISTAMEYPVHDAEVNIVGTLNIIGAAKEYGVRRIVFASTSAVYHPVASNWGANEISDVLPQTPYGISKLSAEHYLQQLFGAVTVLRLGNVYGPRQLSIGENQVVPRMINHLLHGADFAIHGDGEQIRDYVYVKDVAQAFLLAMEEQGFVKYNIARGTGQTVNQLAVILAEMAWKPAYAWKHDAEDPRGRVVLDVVKARKLLGWSALTELEDGLQKTMKWWQSRHA